MSVSGLGMAIVRLLYVKAPNVVKFSIGDKNLLWMVGAGGILLTSSMTLLFGNGEARSRAAINMCMSRQHQKGKLMLTGED